MIVVKAEVGFRTYAAVKALAASRGQSVKVMVEGILIGLSWQEHETHLAREVARMHAEGLTVAWMGSVLNVPNNVVQAELRKQGLRANRPKKVITGYQRKANQ